MNSTTTDPAGRRVTYAPPRADLLRQVEEAMRRAEADGGDALVTVRRFRDRWYVDAYRLDES